MTGNQNHTATTSGIPSNNIKPIKLLPIPVLPYAPVRQDERQHYLKLLYNQYSTCNTKFNLNHSINQLIAKSVNIEFKIATSNKLKSQYQHEIKKLMFNLKKFGTDDGLPIQTSISSKNITQSSLSSSSSLPSDPSLIYLKELKKLCIPHQRLKRHNYVMEIPSLPNPNYKLPSSIECSHCGIQFKISEISKQITCKFHPGKLQTRTKNDSGGKKIYGTDYANRYYSCCNEPKGQSQGCSQLNHHVYKFKNSIDLHLSKNFQKINNLRKISNINDSSKAQLLRKEKIKAVGLDCEMCYTNKGFELMKLSMVDFKTEKKLIDTIVHPDGDLIIDLNSHVSGISEIPQNSLTFDELMIKLAQFTDDDTIIVGHGLENDLNVLRLIYSNIVDTAILFSENQVDVRRKDPLKKLAWSYLSENIQGKEHDSLEDAIIPIRIVKKHIDRLNTKRIKNKH